MPQMIGYFSLLECWRVLSETNQSNAPQRLCPSHMRQYKVILHYTILRTLGVDVMTLNILTLNLEHSLYPAPSWEPLTVLQSGCVFTLFCYTGFPVTWFAGNKINRTQSNHQGILFFSLSLAEISQLYTFLSFSLSL